MKNIEELIKSSKKYKNAQVQNNFDSKKNTVSYMILNKKPRLVKWFAPGFKNNMEKEYSILKKGYKKLNIPTPVEIDKSNNTIIMNYIVGKNLCDIINDEKYDFEKKIEAIKNLANWFFEFHNFFKTNEYFLIRGDSILRNFVLTDKVWGVDFEETRKGEPIIDIASMCSSILSTTPMFTEEKFKLCKKFIEEYEKSSDMNLVNIGEEISYALLETSQRRIEDEDIIRKYALKIREKGLIK